MPTISDKQPAMGGSGNSRDPVDPSENVKALMEASLKALAELRASDQRFYDNRIECVEEASRCGHQHLAEMAELRAANAALIRASDLGAAEKTRQVDVLASAASAATLATAVSTLQTTSDRNAETLRNQVSGNATTLAKQVSDAAVATQLQTDNLFRRVDERVAALERAAATGAGRQSVSDPQMERLTSLVEALARSQAAGSGRGEGVKETKDEGRATTNLIVGVVGLVLAVGLAVLGWRGTNGAAPQVVYVPAPTVQTAPTK